MEVMDGEGVIIIYLQVYDDNYCLYIEDNGKGIFLYMQQLLYQLFFILKDSGIGFGLLIVQCILESYRGQIKLLFIFFCGIVFVIKFFLY